MPIGEKRRQEKSLIYCAKNGSTWAANQKRENQTSDETITRQNREGKSYN